MASLLKGLLKLPVIGQRMTQVTSCIPVTRLPLAGLCGSTRLLSSITCCSGSNLLSGSAACNGLTLSGFSPMLQPCRTYKVKTALKRRCSACYFVKRRGRLYVECKRKPRHKQMQKIGTHKLWREDYSKGRIEEAMTWGWRNDRYYWLGDNKFAKHNWLEGKIGRTV